MSWDAPARRRAASGLHRSPTTDHESLHHPALVASVTLTLAWATFAFGGVYPWAYTPLLVACAAIGVACLLGEKGPDGTSRPLFAVAVWLAVVAAGALLQLVPLPATVLARISPATDAYLRTYLLSYSVAAASSDAAGLPWHPLSLQPEATWLALAFLVALGVLLIGLLRSLGPSQVRAIVRALIAIGVVLSVVGIAQKALGGPDAYLVKIYGFWTPRYRGNPFGPFVNRNHFAGWMIMVLPLALAYFAAALHEALGRIGTGWRNKILWVGSDRAGQAVTLAFAVIVMAVALVYSDSRSGLACALFSVSAMAWLALRGRVRRTVKIAIASVFAALLASALFWAGSDVMLRRFTLVPAEIGDRVGAWRDAVTVIEHFPLAGVGLNAYGAASLQYQTVASAWQFETAHNDYLQLAAEGGVLLAVPALLAAIALVRLMRRRVREHGDDPVAGWLRAGAFVGLAAIALQSLVDFSLQIPANAVLFVVLAAIAVHRPVPAPASSLRRSSAHQTTA